VGDGDDALTTAKKLVIGLVEDVRGAKAEIKPLARQLKEANKSLAPTLEVRLGCGVVVFKTKAAAELPPLPHLLSSAASEH